MSRQSQSLMFVMLFALYYLIPLEFRALWQPDETRYAEISREMLVKGNWVTPYFFDLRYFEKPIAGYWVNNLWQGVLGHNNVAVRMGSVFATALNALMLYWLSRRLFIERRTALMAGVIFLTCLLVYAVGTYAVLDPMLALWMTAAMCSYWLAAEAQTRGQRLVGYLLLGGACGLGVLTKGFIALAIPVLAISPWAVWKGRVNELLCYGPLVVVVSALVCAPWGLAIHRQQPDFWHYFFWTEHIQRFAAPDAQHKAPVFYYLPVLLAGSLPWLALLPGALRRGWTRRHTSPGSLYLLSWVVMPLMFFSMANGKLLTYILSCFAPLALLMAQYGRSMALQGNAILTVNAWINMVFGVLCSLALLVLFAPWGLVSPPLFRWDEGMKLGLAVMACAGWAAAGFVSRCQGGRWWMSAALCPLALALCIGPGLPGRIQNTKQPQIFLKEIACELGSSRYILADNTGIASAIAWTLRRSDVMFYQQKGELAYGLNYPDAGSRYVSGADFTTWLSAHRQSGIISLVLMLDSGEGLPVGLPQADCIYRHDRMLLVQYRPLV